MEGSLSTGWWHRFKTRHPELTCRKGESLSRARMGATNRRTLDKYYDKLEETLTKNGIFNSPGQIFNTDECGFPLDHKTGKIVTRLGQKHTYHVMSGDKSQITVMTCVCASGYALPPMVIFDRRGLNPTWTEGEVPGSRYGLNQTGWIDSSLFQGWYEEVFLKFVPAMRPVLLLLDGHSSHYNPEVIKKAAEDNIIIFCLPPNTTNLVQPLDRVCFSSLKRCWHEECASYAQSHPGKVITRAQFCQVFSLAWTRSVNIKNILASFKVTGIQPFSRFEVPLQDGVEKEEYISTTVAFLPFFSPSSKERSRPEIQVDSCTSPQNCPVFPTVVIPQLVKSATKE